MQYCACTFCVTFRYEKYLSIWCFEIVTSKFGDCPYSAYSDILFNDEFLSCCISFLPWKNSLALKRNMILKIKSRYYSYASQMVNKIAILVESETNNYTFSTMFRPLGWQKKKRKKKRNYGTEASSFWLCNMIYIHLHSCMAQKDTDRNLNPTSTISQWTSTIPTYNLLGKF